jgi:hypothetical protein
MKILVECTVVETGEYYAFELEGPENDVEELEESVRESMGVTADAVVILITEIPTRLH